MANFDTQKVMSILSYHLMQIRPLVGHGTQHLGTPMSTKHEGCNDSKEVYTYPTVDGG